MNPHDLFAELLSYPRPGLATVARQCEALVAPDCPGAAAELRTFADFASGAGAGTLEELYTAAFDLDAACSLYVGYHLLGESYKRSVFMLELKRCYESQGLDIGSEVADHLALMLRYLAVCEDPELARELVTEALVPALAKRLGWRQEGDGAGAHEGIADADPAGVEEVPESPHPYLGVLRALALVLQGQAQPAAGVSEEGEGHD